MYIIGGNSSFLCIFSGRPSCVLNSNLDSSNVKTGGNFLNHLCKNKKIELSLWSIILHTDRKRPTITKISSPRGQMWRCALSAVTRSPSPPWLLLDIRPSCWSHSPAGGTVQTARCCTKSSLSRVMEMWVMGDWIPTNIYSNKSSNKTCTLVFSFCHECAIKKLHHGVLLFVLCTSESGTGFCFFMLHRKNKKREEE